MAAALSVVCTLISLCALQRVTAQSHHVPWINPASQTVPFKAICSRKCEKTQEEASKKDYPLYECSCSRSCSVFGDCCFDSPYKDTSIRHKTDFICISIIGRGRYKAVSSCPPDQPSDFCQDGLGHLPPVTSRVTNITYANLFCATCNEDRESLVTWNVELRCPSDAEDVLDNSSDVTTRYVYRSGDFWSLNEAEGSKRLCMYHAHFDDFRFMEGLELRPCANIRKISDCSASWRDLATLKMCRSYEDPVYFHNVAYQNIHCALCNYLNPTFADCVPFHVKIMLQMGLVDPSVDNFCKDRGANDCFQTLLLDSSKGRRYAFANLLNINEKSCVPPRGKRCCEGEAFDNRSKRCRKVVRD